jgi:acetyl esterase/lipase
MPSPAIIPARPRAWKSPAAFLLALLAALRLGADPVQVRLWPGAAPGEKGAVGEEKDTAKPTDNLVGGRTVAKIGNVSDPTITVYRPPADRDTGTAVLVCPGGGFYILAMDLEGTEVCEWLNSIGVTGVLLKYRVPRREGRAPYAAPLEDAQRAMGIVRSRAAEWGIDPGRIGSLGFSAGGELSAILCAGGGTRSYPRVDASDDASCIPNFQILAYPAYLAVEGGTALVPEVAIGTLTPPTFMVMAEDDPIRVECVLGYALALKQAKVPFELHVYPTGGHGYGLRPTREAVTSWPGRAADWMRARGLLGPVKAP